MDGSDRVLDGGEQVERACRGHAIFLLHLGAGSQGNTAVSDRSAAVMKLRQESVQNACLKAVRDPGA